MRNDDPAAGGWTDDLDVARSRRAAVSSRGCAAATAGRGCPAFRAAGLTRVGAENRLFPVGACFLVEDEPFGSGIDRPRSAVSAEGIGLVVGAVVGAAL